MSTPIIAPRLRVAIWYESRSYRIFSLTQLFFSGGGLGGLTLANALSRTKDIAVDVYEATAEFTEIGAGVSVRPRTLRFMAELGLFEDLHAISGKPPGADKDGERQT